MPEYLAPGCHWAYLGHGDRSVCDGRSRQCHRRRFPLLPSPMRQSRPSRRRSHQRRYRRRRPRFHTPYQVSNPIVEARTSSTDLFGEPEYWAAPNTPAPAQVKRQRANTGPWLGEQLEKVSDLSHPLHDALVVETTGPNGEKAYTWRTHTFTSKKGEVLTGRFEGSDEGITIQVGHQDAFASGAPEKYMIEDADLNQVSGQTIESKGAYSFKQAVLVGPPGKEVPVELGSLLLWERLGLVPLGTALNAKVVP
jgi:hypothetical protein